MPVAHVNDIDLYYEVHGDGATVLLIPGTGVDCDFLRGMIDDLATSFRVVAFDPRGAGKSDKPDVPYTIEGMAEDAAGLLHQLNIERATMIGCSMGGRIALALALGHPDLVERLALVGSSAWTPPDRFLSRRWIVMHVLAKIPTPRAFDPQPKYAWKRQSDASAECDLRARLGEIEVPTLIVQGTGDHIVAFSGGEELARGIAGSRLVPVPGSHRDIFTTLAGRTVQEIKQFMAVR